MVLIIVGVLLGSLLGVRLADQHHREQLRNRGQYRAIETQIAELTSALRISLAEHATRQRMHRFHDRDVFAHSTLHEEPETWRS